MKHTSQNKCTLLIPVVWFKHVAKLTNLLANKHIVYTNVSGFSFDSDPNQVSCCLKEQQKYILSAKISQTEMI